MRGGQSDRDGNGDVICVSTVFGSWGGLAAARRPGLATLGTAFVDATSYGFMINITVQVGVAGSSQRIHWRLQRRREQGKRGDSKQVDELDGGHYDGRYETRSTKKF